LRRSISPARDWYAYQDIKKTLQEFAPNVVHTHSAKGGMLGREAAWKLKVPVVVHTVHGAPFHPYQSVAARKFFQACERRAARKCHRLISVADAMTDLMVNAKIATRDKFTTIYSGMEVEPFLQSSNFRDPVRAKYGYADDDIVVIKIARLFHLKGHADLIRAAVEVVPQNPKVQFLLIGDGILRDELTREINRLGLAKHFTFAGLLLPEQIPAHLAAADLLVHASYREGLARALPQALITGIPAISYDVDGAREVVLDGVTGRLPKPGDTATMAAAILELAGNRDLRETWGRAGQSKFSDLFRHQTMTARIRELYVQLAGMASEGV
jgi:glycosyltransferase involved in cell wall biosynthesis